MVATALQEMGPHPRSGRSSAWGDGQITPEMIQAADEEVKTRFPVFYDTTDLSARHDLIRAIRHPQTVLPLRD